MKPWKVYTIANLNNARSENITQQKRKLRIVLNGEKHAKLFHVIETYQHLTFEDLPIYKPKSGQCYYVYMP
jgi:hypothetical protein